MSHHTVVTRSSERSSKKYALLYISQNLRRSVSRLRARPSSRFSFSRPRLVVILTNATCPPSTKTSPTAQLTNAKQAGLGRRLHLHGLQQIELIAREKLEEMHVPDDPYRRLLRPPNTRCGAKRTSTVCPHHEARTLRTLSHPIRLQGNRAQSCGAPQN